MTDDEMWADFKAAPFNIWYGDPTPGLWCPVCNLPSGYKFSLTSDPNDPGPGWVYGCTDGEDHGSAVRKEAS